ncbi:MAG: cytoplasmic protein [Ilumatobacteraceae bacterium]|nr:cytoplasmic protein [Ilumatobacteraceae bacterium]
MLDRIGLIQIDSVNVLARSQEIVLFSRLGAHPRNLLPDATDARELFEYWVHEASHVPAVQYPLYRWKMDRGAEFAWRGVGELEVRRPGFIDKIYERVAAGPVVAGDVSERIGPKGSWWDWDDGKVALEHLFWTGRVAVRRRRGDFARIYELPEQRLPAVVLDLPAPPERDARKELLALAGRYLGVATFTDLTDYHRQKNQPAKALVDELVAEGRLVPVAVDGWKQQAYLHPDARQPRRVAARALLSPFDPIVWNRDRAERLFGFRYRIEIYTPAAKRIHGYYVLPFLLGDALVGRVDLKADRLGGRLLVQSAWAEPGIAHDAVVGELAEELRQMAEWLDLADVVVAGHGDLAESLRAAVERR